MSPRPAAENLTCFPSFSSSAISFISCEVEKKIRAGWLFSAHSLCKCAIGNFFSLPVANWNLFSLQLHETIKETMCSNLRGLNQAQPWLNSPPGEENTFQGLHY